MPDELQSSLICTYLQGTISILSGFFFKHCVILPHGDHDGDHGDAVD